MLSKRAPLKLLAELGSATFALNGCDLRAPEEFRNVARPALQSGITSIATGLIDGVFAVYQPDDMTTDSTSTAGP